MPTNVIPNGEAFSFGQLALHGSLQQINDTDEQDVAVHRPLKRDGAMVEGMGWNARRFEANVVCVGQDFRAQVTRIRDAIRKKSLDVLVHPIHGRVTARCVRITGGLNIPSEVNSATLTLSFIESGIDPQADATASQGVSSKAQALTENLAALDLFMDIYTGAESAFEDLQGRVNEYIDAAQTVAGDPSSALRATLNILPDQIATSAGAVIAAIEADDAATEDVDRFDAVTAADLVYAATLDLADALAANQSPTMRYTVPAPMSYLTVATVLYGVDGLARADEILADNPSITTPHLIPGGTVITVAEATV
jgi:prophage DNA circulation protein